MSPEYKVALLGLVFSVLALPFLLSAWRRHQLRSTDEAMYEVVKSDDSPHAVPVASVSLARARPAGVALAAALLLIAGMIVQIVIRSLAPPAPLSPPVQSGPALPS